MNWEENVVGSCRAEETERREISSHYGTGRYLYCMVGSWHRSILLLEEGQLDSDSIVWLPMIWNQFNPCTENPGTLEGNPNFTYVKDGLDVWYYSRNYVIFTNFWMGHHCILITSFEMCLKFSQLIKQKKSKSFKQWDIKHCFYVLNLFKSKAISDQPDSVLSNICAGPK